MTSHTRHRIEYTDLSIVTTAENIAVLARLARQAGALIHQTPAQPCAPGDPRQQATFRLWPVLVTESPPGVVGAVASSGQNRAKPPSQSVAALPL